MPPSRKPDSSPPTSRSARTPLGLSQLNIANVNLKDRGYKEPNLLTMRDCSVDVDGWSLLSSEVTINDITISGLELTLETNTNFKNNLADLVEILKQQSPATNAPPGTPSGGNAGNAPPESPGKKLKISRSASPAPKSTSAASWTRILTSAPSSCSIPPIPMAAR